MKKIITFSCYSVCLLFLIALGGSQSSCSKNTDCTATITVIDSVGKPVAGAVVKLYANITPPGQVQAQGNTDGGGNVNFTFKLPAIFDILATQGSRKGSGLIQLNVGGGASATVTIK
jgi:hypothetical protein